MTSIYIIILLSLLLIERYNVNIIARRISMFLIFLWILLIGVSSFNPYNLYPVTDRTYLLCLLFVISFTIGITFTHNKTTIRLPDSYSNQATLNIDRIIENKVFIFISIFCVLFLFYAFSQTKVALVSQSVAELRNGGGQDYLWHGNSLLGLTYNLIVVPFSSLSHILLAFIILFRRKKIFLLTLCTLNILLSASINNGRGVLITVIVYMFFILYCCPFFTKGKNIKSNAWTLILTIMVLLGIFAIVSFMTAQRMYGVDEFNTENISMGLEVLGKHIITYFVGPLRSLDYAFENDYFHELGYPTYGQSTFGFVFGFIDLFLSKIGLDITFANEVIYHKLQHEWIWIGINTNFAYTAIFNFYIDFGIIGVLFLPALFGSIIKRICNSYLHYPNPITFLLLGYLFEILYECFFGWKFYYWPNMAYLILLWIMNYYRKRYYIRLT